MRKSTAYQTRDEVTIRMRSSRVKDIVVALFTFVISQQSGEITFTFTYEYKFIELS